MLNHPKRKRIGAPHSDEIITKQAHKDECDIYTILKQYQRTGMLTHIQTQAPRYEDLPGAPDYQHAMDQIIQAEQAFAALPARVRESFEHDPGRFLAAFTDEAQHDRLRSLGLMRPKPTPTTTTPDAGKPE